MKKRNFPFSLLLILLVIASVVSIIFSLAFGSTMISVSDIIEVLQAHLIGQTSSLLLPERIIWQLRLPRVLLGFIVGAALALAGVAMQALVRNEMADPFVLGISSGASVAATLSMCFGVFAILGPFRLPISAFIGAFLTTLLVYQLSKYHGKIMISQLLLSGLVVSMMLEGITKIITLSAPNALGLHNAQFWMSGSLAGAKWEYLTLPLIIILLTSGYLFFHYRTLNVMLLGENAAQSMGVSIHHFQKALMIVSSLLVGATISVSGVIGFVGLICPHLARLLVGSNHKRVLPISLLLGGILVVWTDVIARTMIAPEELPIGALTALIGGPVFILLLKKKRTHTH